MAYQGVASPERMAEKMAVPDNAFHWLVIDTPNLTDISSRSLTHLRQTRLKMIRKHYLTQVGQLITEQKRFRETDFSINVTNQQTLYRLEITYSYEPDYQFIARMALDGEVVQGDVAIEVVACPGGMFKRERYEGVKPAQLNEHIKNWLQRLSNELSSVPIQRQVEEQQREIQHILEQLEDVPKEYFTKQEAEGLRLKLEEMEARLVDNLQSSIANQTELDKKVKSITSDMSYLKENMATLNKQGWAKSFVRRTFEWAKDPVNRNVLTAGVQATKELLLEAGKHIPPMN